MLSLSLSLSPPPLSRSSYPVSDDVEGRNKELVANEGERVEHVEDAKGVQDDSAALPLLLREQVRGEEGVVAASVAVGGKLNAERREGRMSDGERDKEGRSRAGRASETLAVSTISSGQRRCCH